MAAFSVLGGLLTIYLFSTGRWIFAAFVYITSGIVWVMRDQIRPAGHRPMYVHSPAQRLMMVVIWPVRACLATIERLYALSSADRFTVHFGEGGLSGFRTWNEAFNFACQKAKELGEDVEVFDLASSDVIVRVTPEGKAASIFL